MKKNLLVSAAILIGIAGFSQNSAKKAVNPKYLQKKLLSEAKIAADPKPTANGGKVSKHAQNVPMSTCSNIKAITTSFNFLGVGGGINTSPQNCLSYNSDLNTLVWTQRGSKTWALSTTSGFMQATLINASTLVTDSVIVYADGGNNHHARYPSGVLLNAVGNTDYHKAFAVGAGQVTSGTAWTGGAYCAKPLSSASAVNHTTPSGDSLYTAAIGGIFGNCASTNFSGAPSTDMQALPDGKTVVAMGQLQDNKYISATNQGPVSKATFVKGVLDNTGKIVNWTVDSSLAPASYVGSLGHLLYEPRMAFGPDGLHGYVVFIGRLSTTYNNKCDSSMTPIVYQTTNGGNTWNQVLAGYDWMTNHPEVVKNVGELSGRNDNYSFTYNQGVDLTVDANNVLHYVSTVNQPYVPNGIDSLISYIYKYDYDYINYHPIIWDFMTDGTCWKTMMVDSIKSALCSNSSDDTTSTHSAMGGATILAVTSHITISRSVDGTKVFYGWADSDPSVTGVPYNTSPDILMKAYDISAGMVSATKNVTNGIGTCFYPFLSDLSYFDAAQSAWVVPAVYTSSGVQSLSSTPQITYDASSQADYYYTNCGTFSATDFATAVSINNPTAGLCSVGIKANNTFEGSISNYPNPFNNTTTISVTLSENKAVDVKIYNAIGNLVFNKKVNGTIGENTVSFDGGQLSSGVYYYTVTAGNQQATKKMIIQK
jgi:hypothetical protein